MRDFLEFFGFNDDPFKITPDASYFFFSKTHQEVLSSLKYLVESEEGFAVIVGEPGTGKTLTLRKFIDDLPDEVEFAYVLFPNLSPEDLFAVILEDFGIQSQGETKNKLFAKLRDFLIEKRQEGKKVLVIVDEAQNLPVETLEELRILSNLETEDMKLLQIILAGQPELEEKLTSPKLRQLRQRITVFVKLSNLSEEETKDYINFRISKAGGGNVRIHPKAYKLVYKYSNGIPRIINTIMERALMAAYVDASYEIKPEHIERAVESLGLASFSEGTSRIRAVFVGLAFLAFTSAVLWGAFKLLAKEDKTVDISPLTPIVEPKEEEKPKEPPAPRMVSQEKKEKEQKQIAFVNVPWLNMREKPSRVAPIIYVLQYGDALEILDQGPDTWIKVRYVKGDKVIEGWVNGKYVRRE